MTDSTDPTTPSAALSSRRSVLAGLAASLSVPAGMPARDPARAGEARARLDALLRLLEVEDEGTLRVQDATAAAGLAVLRRFGLDPGVSQVCGVQHAGRLYVVEGHGYVDDRPDLFLASITPIDLRRVGRI